MTAKTRLNHQKSHELIEITNIEILCFSFLLTRKPYPKFCQISAIKCGFNPVGTRYCSDVGFLLDLHRDIDRLRFEIEVTSLYDIFFQHLNDVVAIT